MNWINPKESAAVTLPASLDQLSTRRNSQPQLPTRSTTRSLSGATTITRSLLITLMPASVRHRRAGRPRTSDDQREPAAASVARSSWYQAAWQVGAAISDRAAPLGATATWTTGRLHRRALPAPAPRPTASAKRLLAASVVAARGAMGQPPALGVKEEHRVDRGSGPSCR